MTKWQFLLDSIDLNAHETKLKKQFLKKPEGRSFFAISQILRQKNFIEEAIILLNEGLTRHPQYISARVGLAELYFYKGLFFQSDEHLGFVSHKILQNSTAQKLLFFISILKSDIEKALSVHERMINYKLLDADSEVVGNLLTRKGHESAKTKLIDILKNKGLMITSELLAEQFQVFGEKEETKPKSVFEKVTLEPIKANQFFVMPIDEILFPIQDLSQGENKDLDQDFYIDSPTMAKIYESQDQFEQALGIYKRLLLKSPQNDSLRQKVASLQDKVQQKKLENPVPSERLIQSMREVEKVDEQINQIRSLLSQIESV